MWLSEDRQTKVEVIELTLPAGIFQRIIVKRRAVNGWICTHDLANVDLLASVVDLATLNEVEGSSVIPRQTTDDWLSEAGGYHEFKP